MSGAIERQKTAWDPKTGDKDRYELLGGCWEWHPGPTEKAVNSLNH